MNKTLKKMTLASLTGLMACSAFAFNGANIKAAESDGQKIVGTEQSENEALEQELLKQVDSVLASYNNLTPEQKKLYDETMQAEIAKHQGEEGFDEERFKQDVNSFVFADQSKALQNEMARQGMLRWKYTGIWLSNGVVASGINLAITLATGGATTVGIKMLVKKVGTKAAINVIEKAVKNKLIWFGLKQVSGITPVISTIVKNVLDPGTAVAKWYDSRDIRPNNGHCDIA